MFFSQYTTQWFHIFLLREQLIKFTATLKNHPNPTGHQFDSEGNSSLEVTCMCVSFWGLFARRGGSSNVFLIRYEIHLPRLKCSGIYFYNGEGPWVGILKAPLSLHSPQSHSARKGGSGCTHHPRNIKEECFYATRLTVKQSKCAKWVGRR